MTNLSFNTSYDVNLNTFYDKYIHNIQRVSKRIEDYTKDPNEDNIHDLRTSIRRLEASYQSSPKQLERKKIKKYVDTSKHLFKLNSEMRDFDVILEKLTKEGKISKEQLEPLKRLLERDKGKKLDRALSIANKLKRRNGPYLIKDISYNNPNKIQKKLTKKYNKIVGNFASRIEKNLPVVINDSEKIYELHEIRKDSKKLRYLFELFLDDGVHINKNLDTSAKITEERDDSIQGVSDLIKTLETIQNILGNIHDYDVTIALLREHDKYEYNEAKNNITLLRKNRYEQFVQYCKSELLKSDKKPCQSL